MALSRRTFLAGLGSAAAAVYAQRRSPNIVWIMADDLGVGDLGCYGQRQIRTPHIDRLATEGMRFDQAYAGCTVCAPSRSVLMTGLHMGHTSVRGNSGGISLLDSDVTVAVLLRKAGYRTGMFGKWGLGDIGTPGAPDKQGFDEYCGYLHQVHAHWFYPEFLYQNGQRRPLPGNTGGARVTYSHDVIGQAALDFIGSASPQPYFAYLPFTIPHVELLAPADAMATYRGKFPERPYTDKNRHYADQPESRAAYAAMIGRLDSTVGQVLDQIRRRGQDRDTLIFFTSDNGGATRLWGDDYFGSYLGLRGHKQNLYEGGIRTPLLARWPGKIRPGTRTRHLFSFQDFLPTAMDVASAATPTGLDGISALPELLGRGGQRRHESLYWELPRYRRATGTFFDEIPMQALREGDWKAVRPQPNGPVELYNLAADPGETEDRAAEQPDRVRDLTAKMAASRVAPRVQTEDDRDNWWSHKPYGSPA